MRANRWKFRLPASSDRATVSMDLALLSAPNLRAEEQNLPLGALSQEGEIAARLQAASETEIKASYLRCSQAARQGRLSTGGAAMCSLVYEALLKRVFGGDFEAFLVWSRLHPDDGGGTDVAGGTLTRPQ